MDPTLCLCALAGIVAAKRVVWRNVALLLVKGKSCTAIKDELFISLQTLKNRISRIYGKLDARTRVELINLVRNTLRSG